MSEIAADRALLTRSPAIDAYECVTLVRTLGGSRPSRGYGGDLLTKSEVIGLRASTRICPIVENLSQIDMDRFGGVLSVWSGTLVPLPL